LKEVSKKKEETAVATTSFREQQLSVRKQGRLSQRDRCYRRRRGRGLSVCRQSDKNQGTFDRLTREHSARAAALKKKLEILNSTL